MAVSWLGVIGALISPKLAWTDWSGMEDASIDVLLSEEVEAVDSSESLLELL